jgi:hypothetical protein
MLSVRYLIAKSFEAIHGLSFTLTVPLAKLSCHDLSNLQYV